ncbi:MAG: peptidoglycan D,D-transpeptidase FtsI family protein [Acidimicrobiia bacterium]
MGRRRRRALNTRLVLVGVVMVLAWGGVAYRLVQLQGFQSEEFAAQGLDQRLRRETLAADRGTIFDRAGRELAVTVDAVTVYANPREIGDPEVTARLLAPLLNMDPETLRERLDQDKGFVYVARQLERDTAGRVRRAELPGIYLLDEPKRVYPVGGLTAQVIGFVRTTDNRGIEGLEFQYDEALSGRPGELLVERDPFGRTIPQGNHSVVPAEPGSDLVLTIQTEIQHSAHKALAAALDRTGARSGSVIVIVPEVGEILAMVNLPSFDPNNRGRADPDTFRNRAVTDVFEPGSTQKLITVAAALEAGVVEPTTPFDIPPKLKRHDTMYTDFTRHPDRLTVAEIVAYSSNVGTILVGDEMDATTLHDFMSVFGQGRSTGIDYPGEAAGILHPAWEWCETTCGASTAIGYRVSVTALQMAMVYATIANDGVWVQPHLVKEIVDGQGGRRPMELRTRRVVSAETAAQMRLMLEGVVDSGTGRFARVDGYRVGGKTGTTKKYLEEQGVYGDEVVASFIGMAPVDDPRVVVVIVLDAPQNEGSDTGGSGAAPVFAEVVFAALHQLGIPPDGS